MWLSLAWGWIKSNCSLKTLIKFFLTFVRNFTAVALHGRAGEKKVPSIFSRHDNREASVSLQQVSRFPSHQFQFLSYTPSQWLCERGLWPCDLMTCPATCVLMSLGFCTSVRHQKHCPDVWTILQGQQRASSAEVLSGQPQLPRSVLYFSITKDMLKNKKKTCSLLIIWETCPSKAIKIFPRTKYISQCTLN